MSGSSSEELLDLTGVRSRYAKASAEIDRLAAAQPGNAWRWSIPANPDRDTDIILMDSLVDVPLLLFKVDHLTQALAGQDAAYAALEQQYMAQIDAYAALVDQVAKMAAGAIR